MLHITESLILTSSAATVGVALCILAYALRGRRTDDHPLCRKCGFDLFGLPATSARCPECGRDVTVRRAVRVGHRRKRRLPLAMGLLLFSLAVTPIVVVKVARARGVDWNQYKPVSWLLRETNVANSRDAAMRQLISRLTQRRLSNPDLRTLAHHALAHQGDRSQTWLPEWGTFLETAYAQGDLTDTEWNQYCRQGADVLALDCRDTLHKGRPVPFRFVRLSSRVAPSSRLVLDAARVVAVAIDDCPLSAGQDSVPGNALSLQELTTVEQIAGQTVETYEHLAEGNHAVAVTIVPNLKDRRTRKPIDVKVTVTRPIRLIPDDQSIVQGVDEPALERAMRSKVSVSVLPEWGTRSLTAYVTAAGCPRDLAVHGTLRLGRLTYDLGLMTFPAHETTRREVRVVDAARYMTRPAGDVILEPSADAAECTLGMKQYWNRPMTFTEIPIPR
jgi:hypothetical protein